MADTVAPGRISPGITLPRSPWLSIWLHPGETITQLTSAKAWLSVLLLGGAGFAGIAAQVMIDKGELSTPGDWQVVAALVAAGFVFGVANLFLTALLFKLFGRLLGGHASQTHLRTALAWGTVPVTCAIVVNLLSVICLKLAGINSPQPLHTVIGLGMAAFAWGMALWTFVITVAVVRRVQHFSTGRAIANAALAWILGGAGMTLAIVTFVAQPLTIWSAAMMPALRVGDNVIVSKYAYGYSRYSLPFSPPLFEGRIFASEPQRGDVVAFRLLSNPERPNYVRRIVGLPGDRIQMKGGALIINDAAVERERLDDGFDGPTGRSFKRWRMTLPGYVSYVAIDLVDNGSLDNTQVQIVPPSHYFVLGDNLDNSPDSRGYIVSYVPFEKLIGRVEFIHLPIDPKSGAIRVERIGLRVK